MEKGIILSLKGLIIGFGKIIPGISGSLLAVIFNVYEECLERISHLFINIKENIYYLGCLGIGILISIIFGSRIITYFLNNYYFYTMFIILGLVLGILPGLFKKSKIDSKKDIIIFIIPLIFIYSLETFNRSQEFIATSSLNSYFTIILIGFLEALTTIIPGISGTATFMMLGFYNFVLDLFSNPFTIYLLFFIIGLILGVFLISNLMNFLFKKYHHEIYLIISSLTLASLIVLFKEVLNTNYSISNLFIAIILLIISYILSHFLNK